MVGLAAHQLRFPCIHLLPQKFSPLARTSTHSETLGILLGIGDFDRFPRSLAYASLHHMSIISSMTLWI